MIQPIRPQDASGVYQRQVEQAPPTGPTRGHGAAAPGVGARHDEVTVSGRAQQLRRVMQVMPEVSDVREARIAALQAQIESGQYDVDATSVAQRLVNDGLAL